MDMTAEQMRKAIHYSHTFLSDSVQEIRHILNTAHLTSNMRDQFVNQLKVYEADLKVFEELNDKWS